MSIRKRLELARAWLRAWRRGYSWCRCPSCQRMFSTEELQHVHRPEYMLSTRTGGAFVCKNPICQNVARQWNARQ